MFSLKCENRLLVEDLLQSFFKDKLFELIANKLECKLFDGKVNDLAQMIKIEENIYRDFQQSPLRQCLDGNEVFDSITDKVLKMDATGIDSNLYYWYDNYISKLLTIKNLYGIVGVDRRTNEVINMSNPFRVASLIHRNPLLNFACFYVYKKTDIIEYPTSQSMQETLDTYLTLLVNMYRKGLKAKKEIILNKYIALEKCSYPNTHRKQVMTFVEDDSNETKISYYSYLYFSDILLFNSFMPHYAVFNLKIKNNRLYNNYFKYLPMFSPNVNIAHNCCTGNLPQVSKEGIECLKISNLGSPFFREIFTKDTSYYVDLNINKAKKLYEEAFKREVIG